MHKYLSQYPNAPVARLKEVCAIKPKSIAALMPSVSFGVIIMDLVEGYPMLKLQELCMMSEEAFQQAPSRIRKLIPTDKDRGRRLFAEVNRLIQFPLSVGIQSQDGNILENIVCTTSSDGEVSLVWIDMGQFQPHAQSTKTLKRTCTTASVSSSANRSFSLRRGGPQT